MALRRRCDVNDIRRGSFQHLAYIGEALQNAKPFTELSGHERFQIRESNDVAARDSTNRPDMLICDFTATDYCNAKHLICVRSRHWSRTARQMLPSLDSSVCEVATLVAS